MEQDTRIGLAMGILLIGIVGALFFRNERNPNRDVPQIEDPEALDEAIAERPIAPYLSPRKERDRDRSGDEVIISDDRRDKPWDMPEFLRRDSAGQNVGGTAGPPAPIRRPAESEDMDIVTAMPDPRPFRAEDRVPVPVDQDAEPAAEVQKPNEFTEYKVQSGDTLSEIAHKFLGASSRYSEIYEANRDRLRSPNDLRIGRVIRIPRSRQ